jgi:hypothetical protein
MSIIETLNIFNKTVLSQSNLELEVRFNFIKNKSDFENIYNTLLKYGFKRDFEKHILKICFSDKRKSEYMDCETDSSENIRSEIQGLNHIKDFCTTETMPNETTHIKKTKLSSVNNKDYGFKIVICKEIPCSEYEIKTLQDKFKKYRKTFRLMNRLTLKHPDMPGILIDMSIVKMKTNVSKMGQSGIFESMEIYEIEIEIEEHDKPIENLDIISNYIKKTIKYILCGKNDTNFPISEKIKQETLNEYKNLFSTSKYASFIGPSSYTLQKANLSLEHSPCIKKDFCVTDKADGLRKLLFVAKDKNIYFITNTNPINVQFTGRTVKDDTLTETLLDGEYIKYDKDHNQIDLFAAFDIYFYKNGEKVVDIRKTPFKDNRYPKLKELIEKINESADNIYKLSIKFIYKEFHFISEQKSLYFQCQYLLDQIGSPSYMYNTDGIIFSSSILGVGMETMDDIVKNKKYAWKHSFKWKPPEFNTIDFLVKFPTNDKNEVLTEMIYNTNTQTSDNYQIIYLYVGNANSDDTLNPQQELLNGGQSSKSNNETILFIPINPLDTEAYKAYILIENGNIYVEEENGTKEHDIIYNNNVVEFKYTMNEDKRMSWVPLRIRYDKSFGNNKNTANSNWNSIHNPVTSEMLTNPMLEIDYEIIVDDTYYNKTGVISKTTHLREFHNKFIKKTLYNKYCNLECNIIDYAVGKGGDLHKWLENKASFVLGIDLSKDNINNINDGACIRYIRQMKKMKDKPKNTYIFIEGNTGKKINNDFGKGSYDFAEGNKISEEVINHITGINKSTFTNMPLFGIVKKGFDLGTIQFALHYMFESKEMIHNFMWNCCKTIKLNGHLIGTCYDGELVYEMLKDKKINELNELHIDGSKIWHIKKKYKNNDNFINQMDPCGYKIGVFQDSINTENDEYLVHFKYFERLMTDYGFKLVQLNSFETYYKAYKKEVKESKKKSLSKEEKKISFLNKAFVFEKINDVDPNLVYNYNTSEKKEEPSDIFITSKPMRLKTKITLTNII